MWTPQFVCLSDIRYDRSWPSYLNAVDSANDTFTYTFFSVGAAESDRLGCVMSELLTTVESAYTDTPHIVTVVEGVRTTGVVPMCEVPLYLVIGCSAHERLTSVMNLL